MRSAGPALLFGLRLWAAVGLALYVAFWLELDNPHWAGTSAAVVSLPTLGASLRKASFRMVGTIVGAVAIVVLTASFPQDRAAFIVGLALWSAICGFVGTTLQNFASYGAAMAGVTAAVIALDELGATGGPNGQAFMFAVTRATEICIGIVCATAVAAGSDFGNARHRLSGQIVNLASEIAAGLIGTFTLGVSEGIETRAVRRNLTRRVIDLGPSIDEAIGESSDLRYRQYMLLDAVDGLYAALARWHTAATDLEAKFGDQARREARIVLETLPKELCFATKSKDATAWLATVFLARRTILAAVRALVGLRGRTPSLQLISDNTAEALLGIRRALDGLVLLVDPGQITPRSGDRSLFVPDFLPALINAARVFLTIIAVGLVWIATGWPSGATAIAFRSDCDRALTQRRSGLYRRVSILVWRGRERCSRSNHQLRGATVYGLLFRFLHGDWPRLGSRGRAGALECADISAHSSIFHSESGAIKPCELRPRTILQWSARDCCGDRRRRSFVSAAASTLSDAAGSPASGSHLAGSASVG